MAYCEVATQKMALKNQGSLTYECPDSCRVGDIVRVSLGKIETNGIVLKLVKKPEFNTKPLISTLFNQVISPELLKLIIWISEYYGSELPNVIQTVLPRGLERQRRLPSSKRSKHPEKKAEHALTSDQKRAIKSVRDNKQNTTLLRGATGSGKTRIYIELAKHFQQESKSVIILVPEIGLTAQVVQEFERNLEDIFVVHSDQTESERHHIWQAIALCPAPIVIGARSALFAPVKDLGLIVIDEEHDQSYKQDKSPKYNAVRVASKYASLSGAKLVLGSATPAIEDMYLALETKANVVVIENPINKNVAKVRVIDLRSREEFGARSRIFSIKMLAQIEEVLSRSEQAMIFHNRRGTASQVQCSACGWVSLCPSCYLPMTFHKDFHKMICHSCGLKKEVPFACPSCKQPELKFSGFGTKQLVDDLERLFPEAKIARFDSDQTKKESLSERYKEIESGEIDILIGTQMISKGLDLPKLTYVGVVLADTTLYLPDFSANERTFQLTYQVIGRSGRHLPGIVDIQTYTPDHPAIARATKKDYEGFYANEIAERSKHKYPPFAHLLVISQERAKQESAEKVTEELVQKLQRTYKGLDVLGPSPAFKERTRNGYRWQVLIKSPSRGKLVEIVENHLPQKATYDLDPSNLL